MGPASFEELQDQGYTVIEGAVAPALVADANAQIDDFKARNRRTIARNLDRCGRMHRVVNLHLAIPALAAVFSRNEALEVCDRFFAAETALYTSLLFERGSEQALHRDSPLFVTRPEGRYLGVWAALEPTNENNGPLVVVAGSHRLPAVDVRAIATDLYGDPACAPANDDAGWTRYQDVVRSQVAETGLRPQQLHVRAGDVIVWHPTVVHGGARQRDPHRSRRSLVMHVTPRGMPVYHQDVFFHPERDVPSVASFGYTDDQGRAIADARRVDFGHEFTVGVSQLHVPGERTRRRVEVTARRAKHGFLR